MTATEKCPKCGYTNEGLNLDETDGGFICADCGEKVSSQALNNGGKDIVNKEV